MTKTLIFLLTTLFFLPSLMAQTSETDPRHENHYKYIAPIITDEVKIEISNMYSQMNFAQIKLRITNKTNDFMALKSDEIIFRMNGIEYRPNGKIFMIGPRDYITRTIRVDGDNRFHIDRFSIDFDGFYRYLIAFLKRFRMVFESLKSDKYIKSPTTIDIILCIPV